MTLPARLAAKLPVGSSHDIAGRGQVVVWDTGAVAGREHEPPLVMLHGWNVNAGLTFANALDHLRDRYRVIMFDLHGHGRGFRNGRFGLERCAHDTVAILAELGVGGFVPVGYSMGGAIAQLLARQPQAETVGLVVAASSSEFSLTRRERSERRGLQLAAAALKATPPRPRQAVFGRIVSRACRRYPDWINEVVLAGDPIALVQAGAAMRGFDSTEWLHELDLPTAVVVTRRDRVVAPERQRTLAASIRGARTFEVNSNHDLPIRDTDGYGIVLRRAADFVLA